MQRPERRHRVCNDPAAIHVSNNNNNKHNNDERCSVCAPTQWTAIILHNRSYFVSTSAFEQYLSFMTQNEGEQW